MKSTIIYFLLAAAVLFASHSTKAQDVHFSQFYEANMMRNPGLTGVFQGDYRVSTIYRSQWGSISQPFRTGLVDVEVRIPVSGESGDFFGIGVMGFYDKAGSIELKTTGVYPAVNFYKVLSAERQRAISVGLMGGYLQRSFNPAKMTFNNQYVGGQYNAGAGTGEPYINNKLQSWDFGGGAVYHSNAGENDQVQLFTGLSVFHLSTPKANFFSGDEVRLGLKLVGTGGVNYKLDDIWSLQAQASYTRQGKYTEAIAGGLISWKRQSLRDDEPSFAMFVGAFYRYSRNSDAAIPTLKVEYKSISIGASYDVNISRLRTATNAQGGFELSMVATGTFKNPRYTMSRTMCPKFW